MTSPDDDSHPKTAAELFGRGAAPRDTRERILFAALELFYVHGIHAVGLDRVLGEVGVTKTTFYNHFPSKDHLVLEAVALRDEWEMASFTRQVQEKAGFDPRAALLAVFDVLDDWFNDPSYRGCLFLNASAEFPSPLDPIHRAAAGHYLRAQESFEALARAAGVPEPAAFAREWTALLLGATTSRLVTGDDRAALAAKAVAERSLAAILGARAERPAAGDSSAG